MRRAEILRDMRARLERQTHGLFLGLAACRWLFTAFLVTMVVAPTSRGLALGAILDAGGLVLVLIPATRSLARFSNAAIQMLWPVVWMTMGVPPAHHAYYIFASLAVLATYRDWRVLAVAMTTVYAQQMGHAVDLPWEQLGWITVGALILGVGCVRSAREMEDAAQREATLHQTAMTIQHKVENRTRALQAKTERYQALVENTEAIPFEYDIAERRIVYIAPRAEKLFDATLDEIRAPGFFVERAHPDDAGRVKEQLARFVRGEGIPGESLDYRIVTPQRIVHGRTFLSTADGNRVRGLTIDVTRQAVLEQELRQAQKLESVGRLAAGVAHEINTPVQFVGDSVDFARNAAIELLTVVEAQRHALADAPVTDAVRVAREAYATADVDFLGEELPGALQRALDGVRRIAVIVRSMKVFARQDTAEMTNCDLARAIESTITIATGEYKDVADVRFTHDDLPPVRCHGGEINQVVLNLLINASQAIAATGVRGQIDVELRRRGDDVVISVHDTGPGIPEQARNHVFDHFFTTKPVGTGTGQGLAIAHAIVVDKHHGSLTFDTGPAGTCFYVRIPAHADASRIAA
jgi:signal transduction histidine kinase